MISKEDILERTNQGLDVFKHYIDFSIKPGKSFRNPLYHDKNASCNVYYDKRSGCFKMKDFGNDSYSGDCFWFVATLNGLNVRTDFSQVLNLIVEDLNLPEYEAHGNNGTIHPTIIPVKHTNHEMTTSYKISEKNYSVSELSFWNKYGIDEHVLSEYHVISVEKFESYNKNNESYQIVSSDTDPIFAYKRNGFVKLYRPYNRKFRFLYGGDVPSVYCFGLEQLPNKGDMIFITGGEKDVMSLHAKGFYAICFNSETSPIPVSIIEMLERKFKHIIILYDMDDTGKRESLRLSSLLSNHNVIRMELPLTGSKTDKDVSDYFASGKKQSDFKMLVTQTLEKMYSHSLMLMKSCEMDYNNPPEASKTVVSVNDVPLGTYDNLLCITGGEGTGKSNFVSAIIAGTLKEDSSNGEIDTLGLDVSPNYKHKSILHYDTEQSEYQLYKNICKTLKRAGISQVSEIYHTFYLASLSRKERLQLIKDSMDLYYHKQGGIHLVIIDGIADLIRSANDETESIAIVDELYRLAGIYNTCIICVLHFVPNGIKLRGHIGSELQRKAAAIISIEKDTNPANSVVKAIKVRDGSPLDVPLLLFTWDKVKDMHVYAGEKSNEEKEKRKKVELSDVAKEIFKTRIKVNYSELVQLLMDAFDVRERTAKSYIKYMREYEILEQDKYNNYMWKNLTNEGK